MNRWVGIAFVVIAIWVGMTVFTEGSDRAFGGLLASHDRSAETAPAEPMLDRVRRDAEQARQQQERRIERQLDR